ncbi:MAG TPA: sigma-70 family RNA polymerase sigma factor [Ktedonobacterales bacterium]|jgi:RNA polymerase sigma-70 factor (ECF subfamily)
MRESLAEQDQQMITRIAAGDREALDNLYLRYRQPLFRFLLHLTPDYGLAEELLQDTLVAVWQSARSFQRRSSVQTWLLGIARRQAHNTLRQRGLPLADASELQALPTTDQEPEALTLARASRDELVAAINHLAPVHREILVLTFVHELSYVELSQTLGIPIGTVKSRLSNAKRALRLRLEAREEVER